MRRLICFALALVVTQSAFASFELLCAINKTQKRIDRWDPETGASLGHFADNLLVNPADVAISGNNTLLVADNITGSEQIIYEFNVGTGSMTRQFYSFAPFNSDGIELRSPTSLVSLQFNGSTTQLIGYDLTSGTYSGIIGNVMAPKHASGIWTFGGQLWCGDGTNGFGSVDSSTGAYTAKGTLPSGSVADGISLGGLTFIASGAGASVYKFNSSGGLMGASSGVSSYSGLTGITAGHTLLYAAGGGVGGYGITRVNPLTMFQQGSFATGSDQIGKMVTFVAPEPGTWAVFGAGLLALRRRRSRR